MSHRISGDLHVCNIERLGDKPRIPSPHRAKVSLAALLFGLVGGPAAWFGQFVANYALASFACFPHDTPRVGTGPLWPSVPTAMLAINIAGMAIALLAAFRCVALMVGHAWRTARTDQPFARGRRRPHTPFWRW
ncbi:MAG: hypothetical protein WDN04_18430 [Rhodospirillales bacterium]